MHNTEYEVRAASRNIAGISDYTGSVVYRTLRLQADSITSNSAINNKFYPLLYVPYTILQVLTARSINLH